MLPAAGEDVCYLPPGRTCVTCRRGGRVLPAGGGRVLPAAGEDVCILVSCTEEDKCHVNRLLLCQPSTIDSSIAAGQDKRTLYVFEATAGRPIPAVYR